MRKTTSFFILIFIFVLLLPVLCGCATARSREERTAQGAYIGAYVGRLVGTLHDASHDDYKGEFLGTVAGALAGAAIGYAMPDEGEGSGSAKQRGLLSFSWHCKKRGSRLIPVGYLKGHYPQTTVANVRLSSASLRPGECGSVSFDIINEGDCTLHDVVPHCVVDGKCKVLFAAPPAAEEIAPGEGVSYTLDFQLGKRVKSGEVPVILCLQVNGGDPLRAALVRIPVAKR